MDKFSEVFNEEIIRSKCKKFENTFIKDFNEEYLDESGNYYAFLTTVVSGSCGCYIPIYIIGALGIDNEDLGINFDDTKVPEWFWDTLHDKLESKFVEEFNKELINHGIEGFVYLGFLEADGSYGLFYSMDADLVEKLREEEL